MPAGRRRIHGVRDHSPGKIRAVPRCREPWPALRDRPGLARRRINPDVEMQNVLANPKLLVERDRRVVAVIGLNVDDPGAAPGGDLAQVLDEGGRDALAAMLRADGKVIDVHLAPGPLELVELIGDEPA